MGENVVIICLFLVLLIAGSASAHTQTWDTAFTWNRYHTGARGFLGAGDAQITATISVNPADNTIEGRIEIERCNGDPTIWEIFTNEYFWVSIPSSDTSGGYRSHRIMAEPTVTQDRIIIEFDETYRYDAGHIMPGAWWMRLNALTMDPYVHPCDGCTARMLPSDASRVVADCVWEGPIVTDLVAMPDDLMSDCLEDILASCRVESVSGIDWVQGFIEFPRGGSAFVPMQRVSGDEHDGGYAVTLDEPTLDS